MRRSRSLFLAAVPAVLLSAVLSAAPASGELVDRGEFHDVFSFVHEDFCDVPDLTVAQEVVVDGRYLVKTQGRERLPYFSEHVYVTSTLTNPETELSVRTVERVLNKDLSLDLDGEILTVVFLATGNATVYGPDGKAIARNPGQVRFRVVIDTQGTLVDFDDDEELSFELIKGSTGRSDDFCEAVVGAIQ